MPAWLLKTGEILNSLVTIIGLIKDVVISLRPSKVDKIVEVKKAKNDLKKADNDIDRIKATKRLAEGLGDLLKR